MVLVQNKGDSALIVDMSPPNSAAGATKKLEIPKHHIKKVYIIHPVLRINHLLLTLGTTGV